MFKLFSNNANKAPNYPVHVKDNILEKREVGNSCYYGLSPNTIDWLAQNIDKNNYKIFWDRTGTDDSGPPSYAAITRLNFRTAKDAELFKEYMNT